MQLILKKEAVPNTAGRRGKKLTASGLQKKLRLKPLLVKDCDAVGKIYPPKEAVPDAAGGL